MIHPLLKDVIKGLGITRFVETGTFVGETMVRVSEWFVGADPDFGAVSSREPVEELNRFFAKRRILYPVFSGASPKSKVKLVSVDVDANKQELLNSAFSSNPNISFVTGNSAEYLKKAIDEGSIAGDEKTLFYLDAHWGEYWPLRDEIREVLRLKKAVIVVDDFVVPGHPTFGFDAYKTTICGWYYISDLFAGVDAKIYYPKVPNEDRRGTIFIFVGYGEGELAFLKNLPVFKPFLFKGAPFITIAAKSALWFLTVTGLYNLFVKIYLRIKWGSVDGAPIKPPGDAG